MSFEEQLKEYLAGQRDVMREKWNRILPSNELLFDRWEKAAMLGAGRNSSIYDSSVIMGDVEIGESVWIGPFTVLEGINGKIWIGDYCHISSGVQIVTHDSVKYVLTGGKADFSKGDVIIGCNTYIGGLSIISKNTTIGSHCVIGANSLVTRDIPDYSIAFGTPAVVKGRVVIKGADVTFEYF